jgi:hypothetical protein
MFWIEHHKRANHVEFGRAQLGVGFLVVDISDDSGHADRKLGHGRPPAIEHRDLVPGSNGLTDGSERYLAGTPDKQDTQRHGSLAPNFIFGVEIDTGQHPIQGRVEHRQRLALWCLGRLCKSIAIFEVCSGASVGFDGSLRADYLYSTEDRNRPSSG